MKFLYLWLLSLSFAVSACYNPFKTKKKKETGIAKYVGIDKTCHRYVTDFLTTLDNKDISTEDTISFMLHILSLDKLPVLLELNPEDIKKSINLDQLKTDILYEYEQPGTKEEKIDRVIDVIISKIINPINTYLKNSLPSPINLSTDFIDTDKFKAVLKGMITLQPMATLENINFINTLAIERKMGLEENSFSFSQLVLSDNLQKFQGVAAGMFTLALIYLICKSCDIDQITNISLVSIFIISVVLANQASKKIEYNNKFNAALMNSAINSYTKVSEKLQ